MPAQVHCHLLRLRVESNRCAHERSNARTTGLTRWVRASAGIDQSATADRPIGGLALTVQADQYGDNHDAGADHVSHGTLRAGGPGREF